MPDSLSWRVSVYHNNEKVFSRDLPQGRFERPGIEDLLQRLLSHFALTPDEILLASFNARRGEPVRSGDLDIKASTHSNGGILLECGAGKRSFATAYEVYVDES